MPSKPIVVVLAAGAALSVGGCNGSHTPEPAPALPRNPPAPAPEPQASPDPTSTAQVEPDPRGPGEPQHLPTWDQVASPHPPGATNPPIPTLVVTPEGACFKDWVSPFAFQPGMDKRVVADCTSPDASCGTRIQCPPEADEVLAAWKAENAEPADDGER